MLHFKSGLNFILTSQPGRTQESSTSEFSPVNGHREIRHQLTYGCIMLGPICSFSTALQTTGFGNGKHVENGLASLHSLRFTK